MSVCVCVSLASRLLISSVHHSRLSLRQSSACCVRQTVRLRRGSSSLPAFWPFRLPSCGFLDSRLCLLDLFACVFFSCCSTVSHSLKPFVPVFWICFLSKPLNCVCSSSARVRILFSCGFFWLPCFRQLLRSDFTADPFYTMNRDFTNVTNCSIIYDGVLGPHWERKKLETLRIKS